MHKYHLTFQYAHFGHDQVDDRGMVSREDVLDALSSFDWEAEVGSANQLEKCSPTISVESRSTGESIWISGYGDPRAPTFVSDCAAPPIEKPILFGLFRRKVRRSANSQQLSLDAANTAVHAMLDGDFDRMLSIVGDGGFT